MSAHLCARHQERLESAIELRGLLRDAPGQVLTVDPVEDAASRIQSHAMNFAGKASVRMLADKYCPICFVNAAIKRDGRNPGLTADGWVDNAADETAAHLTRHDTTPTRAIFA